jgi:hypothetical protein
MNKNLFTGALLLMLPLTFAASAQTEPATDERPRYSIAVESDALSWGMKGYSGIVNLTLRNGFQIAGGTGRYELPGFLLKGDDNYDRAGWKATSTSVQVLRVGYRFRGPMKNGPAIGGVFFNQNMRLRSEKLGGETNFRPIGAGISGGYYFHIGKHFYIYPTVAFTRNSVASGSTSVNGVNYHVARYQLQESVHVGWEWGRYAERKAAGAVPVQRRKARVKALGSEKPSRKPTSAAELPGCANCWTAISRRITSTSSRNEVCSLRSSRCRVRSLIASIAATSSRDGAVPLMRSASTSSTRRLTSPWRSS